jgi:hypothetical protein
MSENNFIARPALKTYNTGGGPAGDPYWDNVTLLLQSNSQTAGSTTFTDYSSYNHTVAAYQGTPTHVTDQAIFGTSSIKISNSSIDGTKSNLAITDSDSLFDGDFTVEWWQYTAYDTASTILFSNAVSTYYYQRQALFIKNISVTDGADPTANQWQHFAITKQGTDVRLFVDGIETLTGSRTGSSDFRNLYIGLYIRNNNLNWTGYIDQFRMTDGVARYTENFTPPTEAFPTN